MGRDLDAHRLPAGDLGNGVECADDETAASVGLDDLDVDAVTGQIL